MNLELLQFPSNQDPSLPPKVISDANLHKWTGTISPHFITYFFMGISILAFLGITVSILVDTWDFKERPSDQPVLEE